MSKSTYNNGGAFGGSLGVRAVDIITIVGRKKVKKTVFRSGGKGQSGYKLIKKLQKQRGLA